MIQKILLYVFVLAGVPAFAQEAIEPYTYSNDFESGRLGAWASYPLWQDNAYDPNFQIRKFTDGDSNISLVQKVTPYSHVDNYAGAQKLLDMYLVQGSTLTLRFFLKSSKPVEFFKVRLAAGDYGKLDVTLDHPRINEWVQVHVGFEDIVRENAVISGKRVVHIYSLACLAKVPVADPDMPFYLALDDILFSGARPTAFRFEVPVMKRLPEFSEYIPERAYHRNDTFRLKGTWPVAAENVVLRMVSLTDTGKVLYETRLLQDHGIWRATFPLPFQEGMYIGRLSAFGGSKLLSGASFTIHIAPSFGMGQHPRVLFNNDQKNHLIEKLHEPRFQGVYADLLKDAKTQREKYPVSKLVYDLNQFPDENWLPTWVAFGEHIYATHMALRWNALAYAFNGDTAAGNYAKSVLVRLAGWPDWISPWMRKRGRRSDHRMGTWSHDIALAYDLTYGLMLPSEAASVRKAIIANIVEGAHYTYVYDNEVTSNTSNWIAHIMGGSLMNMAAILSDGPESDSLELYFTGALLKFYALLTHVTDQKDGAWGEGYGYNNYTFSNLAYSIPSLERVFNIDVSGPLRGTYNEYIWGGLIKDRKWFGFGDSDDSIVSANNWAWLLSKGKEPRLSWYYHYMKDRETLDDVLFDTDSIPEESPFSLNPVKVFRKIGTTVFKSGWGKDDLAFVMRTGAFFNHQHIDQGSFWLADRGITFIGNQPIHHSNYYDDPLYQSDFTQPIAHNTILINGNHQSQRTGDPLDFAPGFEDRASIGHFLDGKTAAFSSGDIGKLYWGEVDSLTRNILFIKPRTILMMDVVTPGAKDADVTLLFHTTALGDIHPGQRVSTISREGVSLHLFHLAPENAIVQAVETPHYLNTLNKTDPLVQEGMITETARTSHSAMVMANLLTTTDAGAAPAVVHNKGDGFVWGTAMGKRFAFNCKPGFSYKWEGVETDALALTRGDADVFVAMATLYRQPDGFEVRTDVVTTFERSGDTIRYYCNAGGVMKVRAASGKVISVRMQAGEGRIALKK